MFTFHKESKNLRPIFFIDDKEVYTTFNRSDDKRIKPYRNTTKYLDSDEFRERYSLSRRENKELKRALLSDTVPDNNLKQKFYHIRKDLNNRLYTEIDLRDTKHSIAWKFPKNVKAWPETQIIIGSSGVGKTYHVVQMILRALKQSKKRTFMYISPELNIDDTLKKLMNSKRYAKHFIGIDVSDQYFEESELTSVDDWWSEIKTKIDALPEGSLIVLDDAPDSMLHKNLKTFLIKALRTYRHKKIGIISIQHNVRGGQWTSQSFSSVKWVTLFVRGAGKGKIIDFLYENFGIGRRKSLEIVDLMATHGRYMTIHQWSPGIVFGEKFALFI